MSQEPSIDARSDLGNLLAFWFDVDAADADAMRERRRQWFRSSPAEDALLAERFGTLTERAAAGELDEHTATAAGSLALILLLDQLPRNLWRGTPRAFTGDARALALCQAGRRRGDLPALTPLERAFFLMPLQHAESREVQAEAVRAFEQLASLPGPGPLVAALRDFADYAVVHRDIVDRFGRFPHRNAILGRESTPAEAEFLAAGGPSFGQ